MANGAAKATMAVPTAVANWSINSQAYLGAQFPIM